MGINIIDVGLKFTSNLTKRNKTTAIVLHHRAGTGDVLSIHNQHLRQKWSGCGYNFYVRLDGTIYKGRGWEYIGAHAGSESGYNGKSIGICFEGNFSELTNMPTAQYNAGISLIKEALNKYPSIVEIKGHRDVYATSCPGTNFPLEKMKNILTSESEDDEDLQKVNARLENPKTDLEAFLIGGKTFVELRKIAELLGHKVDWDNKTQTAIIK